MAQDLPVKILTEVPN